MRAFYIFEPLKVHTYETNISLIRLLLIMQPPPHYVCVERRLGTRELIKGLPWPPLP